MVFQLDLIKKLKKIKTQKIFYGSFRRTIFDSVFAIISISFTFIFYNFFENQFIFFGSTMLAFYVFKKFYDKYSQLHILN